MREARWAERQARCPHCGRDRAECSDPEKVWYPQREVCYATMESEAAKAKWAALHEARPWHDGQWRTWAEKRSDSHPYHRDHGLTIGVHDTDLRPDDKFLTHESWGPDQKPALPDELVEPDEPGED